MTTTKLSMQAAPTERSLHPIALAAVLAAVLVPVISFFSTNVALGEIGRDLHAEPAVLQLVIAAYGVVYASLVVIGGRLGDSYGRKRILAFGLVAFALTSLVCAFAQTPEQLVAGRLIQGAAAALVAPQVLASIHANTEGRHRDRALAWFGASAGIGTALAFLVGGSLTGSDLGWRSIFWMNVPIGVLVLFAVLRYLPESKAPARAPLDGIGALLLGGSMALLILPLTEGRAVGWPAWTWLCLAAVIPAALAFVGWQRRLERTGGLPLVPPSLFRFRSMTVGLVAGIPIFLSFGGFMFVYAYIAQSGGMTPLRIGLSLLPMSASFLAASLLSGRLVPRLGAGVLTAGSLLAAAGFAAIGVVVWQSGASFSAAEVAIPTIIAGLGLGLVWSPLIGIVLSQVEPAMAGLGGGIFVTALQAGLGTGSAVVGSIYLSWEDPAGFGRTLALVAGTMVVVAGLTRLLTPGSRRPRG